MGYYTNANPDLLARIPLTARCLLEIGCGAGQFGAACKARNPQAAYVGVEIDEQAGRDAASMLDHVIVGDVERPEVLAELDRRRGEADFDTLIFGDVLEHLRDPWRVLEALRARMAPGAVCVACIPNVSHWSLITQQLKGRWDYADAGLLDRTHIRFFTLDTAREMFRQAGWQVADAKPRVFASDQTEAALKVFAPLAEGLGVKPDKLRRDLSALQWVIRAVNGPVAEPLTVLGLGLKKLAGVNEARVDHPLAALASLPTVRAAWGAGGVRVPPDWPPGVFILHRQFMNNPAFNERVEQMIRQGWLIVAEMDDDPHHWKEFIANDFYAYRAAHAVTVSTEPLAAMMRRWNPNVQVFPNAIFALPRIPLATPRQGGRIRVFFGALNRGPDWAELISALVAAGQSLAGRIEFVIVHDRKFHDAIPEPIAREFHPTLPHDKYLEVLASCDVALLPLADTPFNRLKSDLKFIECCAAGVVPVCSAVVYGDRPEHRDIGFFPATADDWQRTLATLCTDIAELTRRRSLGLEYVKRERMHSHQAAWRESWYREQLARREQLEAQRQARLIALRSQ